MLFRISAAALLVGLTTMAVAEGVRHRADGHDRGSAPIDPNDVFSDFVRDRPAARTIDVRTRFAGRAELVDPAASLPAWHSFPYAEAARTFAATRSCPPSPIGAPLEIPALAKAYTWRSTTCGAPSEAGESFVENAPYLHPSGRSYAALAFDRTADRAGFFARHGRAFHVLELANVPVEWLDDDSRALAEIGRREWDGIADGDGIVLSRSWLIRVQRGTSGVETLLTHPREDWDAYAGRARTRLVARGPEPCRQAASSALCWEIVPRTDLARGSFAVVTAAATVTIFFAALGLAASLWLERRRLHEDRIHVLRTLTHDLRTPATSLGLDIDVLNAAYDDLPETCQEPLLRVSAGIARLNRVLYRSGRYLALFESDRTSRRHLVTAERVPSIAGLLHELSGEWPEETSLRGESADGPHTTDVEWLSVMLRNLVENGHRHGKPRVTVTWRLSGETLAIAVRDEGHSPTFSLRRAIVPYRRDASSSGLGLGLAIVERAARLLGGTLRHTASPTTFELRLPAMPMPTDTSVEPVAPPEAPEGERS